MCRGLRHSTTWELVAWRRGLAAVRRCAGQPQSLYPASDGLSNVAAPGRALRTGPASPKGRLFDTVTMVALIGRRRGRGRHPLGRGHGGCLGRRRVCRPGGGRDHALPGHLLRRAHRGHRRADNQGLWCRRLSLQLALGLCTGRPDAGADCRCGVSWCSAPRACTASPTA
jgi:hypothetical protein